MEARALSPVRDATDSDEPFGQRRDLRILLVARSERSSSEVAERLATFGRTLSAQAISGAQALEFARGARFDVALVQVGPGGDEADRLSAAMNLQALQRVPVVYLVGEGAEEGMVRRARTTMPRGFLFEPFSDAAFESILDLVQRPSAGAAAAPTSAKRLKIGARPDALVLAAGTVPLSLEARFRAVSENTTDLVTILDREGRILYETPSLERLLGYPAGSRIGQSTLALVHPDDVECVRESIEQALRPAAPVVLREYRVRHSNGGWRNVESEWRPPPDPSVPWAVVCVQRDITRRKELELQLTRADRLASLGMLTTAVGHEINNPLTYVLANLETISSRLAELAHPRGDAEASESRPHRSDPPPLSELADQARQASDGARRIARIVRELRTFVRGDDEPEAAVDLQVVLETAVTMAANQLRHRARMVKEYERVPCFAGKANRLVQVFLNLLLNALQALPEGEGSNEIRLRTWATVGEVFVEVRDSGCGIPADHLPRLFDPFFTTKPAGVGTGLGLAISRAIVEGHGGSIEVESEVGKGSSFIVRFPIRLAAEPLSRATAVQARPKARTVRVLIVDDEPLVCSLMKRMLGRSYQVTLTDSVHRAFEILAGGDHFDVILCDLMMPDGPGTLLYERLSETNSLLARRIVFVTGGAFTESAQEFFERVPNLRLDKPFAADDLRAAIDEALSYPSASNPPGATHS